MIGRPRRRRGWGRRGEPVPLLLVPDEPYTITEFIALAFRAMFRYRSELGPLFIAALLFVAGMWLHVRHPLWFLPIAGVSVAVTAAFGAVPARWAVSWPVLNRTAERVYAATTAAVAGLWLAAATAFGPTTQPLPWLWLLGTVGCAIPWWAHHRRRYRVKVDRTLEAWPEIAEAVGLAGSRIRSAIVDRWGFTARIRLRRGQTVRHLRDQTPALESALAVRPGSVRVNADPTRADEVTVRVVELDPHAEPIPWPGKASRTVIDPVELGVFEDGSPVRVLFAHRNALIGGATGSGKSGLLNVVLAAVTGCRDVVIWGIDLKGGMELKPWAACLFRLATTGTEAVALLFDAVAELDRRAGLLGGLGVRLWTPNATTPALLVVIDEYAELPEAAHPLADSLARRGRATAVNLLAATQRPTQKAMGQGAVRSQMDVRICLRVREPRDTELILGQGALSGGWHAHTLDAPGKFLVSAPEHTSPRRARGYLIDDRTVRSVAAGNARHRPTWQVPGHIPTQRRPDHDTNPDTGPDTSPGPEAGPEPDEPGPAIERNPRRDVVDPEQALWVALRDAPEMGLTLADLQAASGMSRSSVYRRVVAWINTGHVVQVCRGRWRASNKGDRP